MNAYWVADSYESMTELELVYVFASVKLWKYYHPYHKTILYTDEQSWDVIGHEGLWDSVVKYSFTTEIIKGEHNFWAAGKLQAMQHFETPFSIMDLDMIYNGTVEFDKPIISAYKELGRGYYFDPNRESFQKTSVTPFSKSPNALNVSFLYIEDSDFHKEYVETSLDWMTTFSESGYSNGGLMTFCEQKLLLDIIERDNIPYRTLIEPKYKCVDDKWNGDWTEEDKKYYHLRDDKKRAKRDETFMLVQKGKILKLLQNIDNKFVKECFNYLKKKR